MWIRKHEERYWKVTVGMRKWHLSWLDRFTDYIRTKHDAAISRSAVVRALIDLAEATESKPGKDRR